MPAGGSDSLVERDDELSALALPATPLAVERGAWSWSRDRQGSARRDFSAGREITSRARERHERSPPVEPSSRPTSPSVSSGSFSIRSCCHSGRRTVEELFTGAARLARTVLGNADPDEDASGADRYSKINGVF
jgi:hypothetical protein